MADPSTFSVNLFGIPEIPEALPSAISPARLHNIVFISSCNLVQGGQPLSADSPSCLVGVTSFSRRVSRKWPHIREPEMGYTGYKEIHEPLSLASSFFLFPFASFRRVHLAPLFCITSGSPERFAPAV